ncbi:MAG: sugar phosphate isomerase/epimerase [Planctomycetota bacterium]|nr:sugar phosphate isomerase/epimerase [Planctomycetota bacterium]
MPEESKRPLRFCFNTSTIRGQKLKLEESVDLAARVGYQGIEPWMEEITDYRQRGGQLGELSRRIRDAGLTVDSAIGFAPWIVDDPTARAKGLDEMRRDMDSLREIGGLRIAAPPVGAAEQDFLDLNCAADRYRALLELGAACDVVPQLELWGFSKQLRRLGEVLYVAAEAAHPNACVLLDVYHLHKGGSDFAGLNILHGGAMHVLHMNDYPALDRADLTDASRVFPGHGVAPIEQILRTLVQRGFCGTLSLELFNPSYWEMDAETVARTGLDCMHALVDRLAGS